MDNAKKNQIVRSTILIIGTIVVIAMAYGSGMRAQVRKLTKINEERKVERRDLRLGQIDLRTSQALTQQLEARRQVALALLELDRRNFGAAQERLGEAAARLENVQKANQAAVAAKPQEPPVSPSDFAAAITQIRQVNLVATPDTGEQRERLLTLATQMDAELSKVAPRADSAFAPITVAPPTLNDVPQLIGNDVTKN